MPAEPGALHAWQAPSQASLQQIPSSLQTWLWHCALLVHAAPLGRAGMQTPPSQKKPDEHASPGSEQVVRQVPAPSHVYPPQPPSGSLLDGWSLQLPDDPGVLHARHAPAHSVAQQTPSVQTRLLHWVACVQLSPSTRRQLPVWHDSLAAHVALSQQKPAWQWPLAQSGPIEHEPPFESRQSPARHSSPAPHDVPSGRLV
jgi:hypothetical protein